jgi:hypothetical protein
MLVMINQTRNAAGLHLQHGMQLPHATSTFESEDLSLSPSLATAQTVQYAHELGENTFRVC